MPQYDPVLTQAAFDSAIVVSDLAKSYGAVEAVRGVSFAVRTGTTTALLGGNGAGKTTTLSMLLGVLTPSAGRISVLGDLGDPLARAPEPVEIGEDGKILRDGEPLRQIDIW